MASGMGVGPEEVEPNQMSDDEPRGRTTALAIADAYDAWMLAETTEEKLADLFRVPRHPWGPGTHARYRDRDIFLAGVVMSNLYKAREGADADVWEMMQAEVYRPIGVRHMHGNWTVDGVPLVCWGAYPTVDDMVRVGWLLQDYGAHAGTQILSRAVVREALYEEAARGLPTGAPGTNPGTEGLGKSYHLTLWHEPYIGASGRHFSVCQMHGFGGNSVVLAPNGLVGFRVGTAGHPDAEAMGGIADGLRPFDAHRRGGGGPRL